MQGAGEVVDAGQCNMSKLAEVDAACPLAFAAGQAREGSGAGLLPNACLSAIFLPELSGGVVIGVQELAAL